MQFSLRKKKIKNRFKKASVWKIINSSHTIICNWTHPGLSVTVSDLPLTGCACWGSLLATLFLSIDICKRRRLHYMTVAFPSWPFSEMLKDLIRNYCIFQTDSNVLINQLSHGLYNRNHILSPYFFSLMLENAYILS